MKHHEYPAALVLSVTLVLFFFVVFISSFELPENNIAGMASDIGEDSACSVEKVCAQWEWDSIERGFCETPDFRESDVCVAYDAQMNCVEWESRVIYECLSFSKEVDWERSCLEWSETEVC